MKKSTLVLIAATFALFVSLTAVAGYFLYSFTQSRPSEQANEVIYEVKQGVAFNTIAHELEAQGVVRNAQLFSLYARVIGARSKVKTGEYLLKTNMIPNEVLAVITSGKSIERSFTVSEGLNLFEIAELYEKSGFGKRDDFWKWTHDKEFIKNLLSEEHDSLEGYLFPETYKLTKYMDAKALVTMMVKRFLIVYSEVVGNAATPLKRHELVTLASIVEKETGAPEERPLIASIFYNRLNKHMKLQTDPTIIYGKAELTGKLEISITREDLLKPTRYNTYVIPALPPGPIANPGKEALLATLKPANSEYLYFVSQNNGTHIFSKDYAAHQKAVQKFQLDPKAREGKSWRDLNKSHQ